MTNLELENKVISLEAKLETYGEALIAIKDAFSELSRITNTPLMSNKITMYPSASKEHNVMMFWPGDRKSATLIESNKSAS